MSTKRFQPEIHVLQRPVFARLFIEYYWLPVILSLMLYLVIYVLQTADPTKKPSIGILIELSFYPLFFWAGGLAKSFLMKKIRYAFGGLYQAGSLSEAPAGNFPDEFQKRLDSRAADAMGLVGGLFILIFYLKDLLAAPKQPLVNVFYILIIAIDLMWGYVIGVAIWKVCATAWELRQLALQRRLKVRPFHPDGAAGLLAIGRLYFSLSMILLSIGVFLSAWIIYAHWVNREFYEHVFHDNWEHWFGGGLVVLIVITAAAFFLPMFPMHRLMEEEAIGA
jgi:hypothetical protein